jgi:hypothetical protein
MASTWRNEMNSILAVFNSWALVSVSAGWIALFDDRISRRLFGSGVLFVTAWALQPVWFSVNADEFRFLEVSMIVQWLSVQFPLWLLLPSFGWKMEVTCAEPLSERRTQFGIRHLILWTTLAAVLMGLVRAISSAEGPYATFGLVVVFNSLVAFPALIGPLLQRGAAKVLAAAAIGVVWGSWFESRLLGVDDFLFFLILNGFQFVWVAGSMWIWRAMGYRLVPHSPAMRGRSSPGNNTSAQGNALGSEIHRQIKP